MYDKEFKFIFDYAQGKVDDIEIVLSATNSFQTRINQQEIESFNYSDAKGLGVRVIVEGKLGYSYTEKFDEESFKMVVDEAVENAKLNEDSDPAIMADYPAVAAELDLYSKELDKVDVEDKIQIAKDLEKYAKAADARVFNVPYAVYGDTKAYSKIANSKGLNKEEKQNSAFCYVGALSQQNDDKRVGIEFFIGRDFNKIDPKKLAEISVKKSTDLLGGKPVKSGKYPVVFNNEMMATMLGTFASVFYADSVHQGKSLLIGKMGQKIANEKVNIIDDALHPEGANSRHFDSEGYPSQKTVLIKSGKLNSYLHNTKTALKDKVNSTGNGSRGYKGSLGISVSNLILEPGKNKENELLATHDKVIEIVALQGMHAGANTISGDFSLSAEGFLYENGKRQHSLKQFTVSGNFLKILQNVEMIADNFHFNSSSIGTASVLIRELAISG
ncbi:MAG: TldD/PmbA family protein [Candidatus Cloacimonetes bacterium]|nr:TldD/PmbA family protein [Candidatus Cloacimonadota bacterium]MCF7813556.1 TldD/PmbA family protein [Candidatus Cloacimonadota bacterium]MCF7868187.1 TldD/PmbA family protein [Candidatus Cloacimonadota bacterium]MCF7883649.1 TldD/PmbA family protein [Candidatus Cloacimonadota bacterium]